MWAVLEGTHFPRAGMKIGKIRQGSIQLGLIGIFSGTGDRSKKADRTLVSAVTHGLLDMCIGELNTHNLCRMGQVTNRRSEKKTLRLNTLTVSRNNLVMIISPAGFHPQGWPGES